MSERGAGGRPPAGEADRFIEWGAATRTIPGETESGDQHLVLPRPDGVLLAVVDGIGHGREAALAASAAVETLEDHAGETLQALVTRCHERLRGMRGVVMSLAAVETRTRMMTWLGVGNVEGVVIRAGAAAASRHERLIQRRGVVGGRLPDLHPATLRVAPGDVLILATDGIAATFDASLQPYDRPQPLADRIVRRYATGTDDATVLVARFTEWRP
ncbi:MAG: SpoIIE family protein phosphatase [Candidatus Polarisedimenticolia bacterium]